MSLARFTRPELVEPKLLGPDAAGALHELSDLLHRAGCVRDGLAFYNEALNREFLLSTDPASGLVLTYARQSAASQPVFAFGRSAHPLDWRPKRRQPVRLVLLAAIPAMDTPEYFAFASGLIRLASDTRLLRQLREASDAGAICAILARVAAGRAGRAGSAPAMAPSPASQPVASA